MSAPFVGKRVEVIGTSRQELNGSCGNARDYDRDKGRYNVHLDSGQVVALKPANLQESHQPPPAAASGYSGSFGGTRAPASGESLGPGGVSWPTIGFVVLGAAWLFQSFMGSGGSGGGAGLWGGDSDEVEYDDRDEGFLSGVVREVVTLDQLRGALAHHSDNTGLPVVVDFFSHSCGPCRMIAPAFKRIAKEFKGQAAFLKVDVNRNYEASSACNIRGMPTFQFYLNKKKFHEFSGADERGLRQYTSSAVDKAEKDGTFVGLEVTKEALASFYETHDKDKVSETSALAEKYAAKTALLMRVSKKKYGQTPKTSPRRKAATAADSGGGPGQEATGDRGGRGSLAKGLADQSVEELQLELGRLKAELERRGADSASEEEEEFPFVAADEVAGDVPHKVVIIGGGPAGLSAATYAARAGLGPLVVAPAFGGQLLGKGVDVENYPGVVGEHATGRGLVELMRRQANSFGARFVSTSVLGVDLSIRPFRIQVNGTERELRAETLILACGAESRWLNVQGEQHFRGQGVSACATCDGFLFRDKDVAVVGGGDHAMEDALHLARSSRRVTVVHRRGSFRASKILAEKVLNHSSIQVKWDAQVESFHGKDGLTHLMLRTASAAKPERLDVAGAFVAIGHDPQASFLGNQVEIDKIGYVTVKRGTETSVPGVFAAGDIADPTYRQAITSSGTGAMAALDAERFLNEER